MLAQIGGDRVADDLGDFAAQIQRRRPHIDGDGGHILGARARALDHAGDARHPGGNVGDGGAVLACVVTEIGGRGALLRDRHRHRLGDAGQLIDGLGDAGQRGDGLARGRLDFRDLDADALRRCRRARRPCLDLAGDHREAASGLAGTGRFDGGVERQQIGLRRDLIDDADDIADLIGGFGQRIDGAARRIGARHRFAAEAAAARDLGRNVIDRLRYLIGQPAGGLVQGARAFGGGGGLVESRAHRVERGHHILGFELQRGGAIDNRLNANFGGLLDMMRQARQMLPARRLPGAVEIVVDKFAALPFAQNLGQPLGGGLKSGKFPAARRRQRRLRHFGISNGVDRRGNLGDRPRDRPRQCAHSQRSQPGNTGGGRDLKADGVAHAGIRRQHWQRHDRTERQQNGRHQSLDDCQMPHVLPCARSPVPTPKRAAGLPGLGIFTRGEPLESSRLGLTGGLTAVNHGFPCPARLAAPGRPI